MYNIQQNKYLYPKKMKTVLSTLFIVFAFNVCAEKKQPLFNGKNLDGWSIHLSDSSITPEEFFYVKDGYIETIGVPVGYLRTDDEFENYTLHIEWRYPEKPTNSGIFVHTNGPDLIWPGHYQGQLKHQNAGDFIVHGVGMKATLADSVYTSTETVKPLIPKLNPSNEKPAGEWNSYDIICNGNTITLKVNGVVQNVATDCSVSKGGIGLQAEGSKIQYRNLWVKKIK